LEVSGDLSYNYKLICDSGVRGTKTDINALACKDKKTVTVLIWNYHDVNILNNGSTVLLKIRGISARNAVYTDYRIDSDHSNSYEVWKKTGSPQHPTSDQIALLEKSGKLESIHQVKNIKILNNEAVIRLQLPRQAVTLVKLTY